MFSIRRSLQIRETLFQEGRRAATELRWPLLLLALLFAVSGLGLARSLLCLALAALFLWAVRWHATAAERRVLGLPWWQTARRIAGLPPSVQGQIVTLLDDIGRVQPALIAGHAYVPTGRYGGTRLLPLPPPPELSAKALALGLRNRAEVEAEYWRQHGAVGGNQAGDGFWRGTDYLCPACGSDFWSPSGARKHMATRGHRVLRTDWLRA